jgi:hypothetical protein
MSPFLFFFANLCGTCVSYEVDAGASVRHLTSILSSKERKSRRGEDRQSLRERRKYVAEFME